MELCSLAQETGEVSMDSYSNKRSAGERRGQGIRGPALLALTDPSRALLLGSSLPGHAL